jgi:hypothetical protein
VAPTITPVFTARREVLTPGVRLLTFGYRKAA